MSNICIGDVISKWIGKKNIKCLNWLDLAFKEEVVAVV